MFCLNEINLLKTAAYPVKSDFFSRKGEARRAYWTYMARSFNAASGKKTFYRADYPYLYPPFGGAFCAYLTVPPAAVMAAMARMRVGSRLG